MRKHSITILCVDADGFGLEVRRMVLESFGCKVTTCTRAGAALEQLNDQDYNVVIMDFAVEEMTGDELARNIKAAHPNIPLLMLSNLIYPPESVLPYIDGFATKGDSPRALMAMIQKSLRGSSRRSDSRPECAMVVGGLAVTDAAWLFTRLVDKSKSRKRESASDPEVDRQLPEAQKRLNPILAVPAS
jgi:CheY-like chemotaxis protein